MGEFSLSHIIFVLLVVLVIFGPSKLPGLGKGMGEAIRGFKKGLNEDKPEGYDAQAQLREPAVAPRFEAERQAPRTTDARRDSEIHPS